MIPKQIANAAGTAKAPDNWDGNGPLGKCVGLPIRVEHHEGLTFLVSEWEPTPAELELLNKGANVVLMVSAPQHPVVSLSVSMETKEVTDGN